MKKWLRKHYEAFLIRMAARILMERNVVRCMVVSRRDNNDMWYMAEKLDAISDRIKDGYEHV
jgi:hypothetical protein